MKRKEIFKRSLFVISGLALVILFTFCGNDENTTEESIDTASSVEVLKKSREELIINRDTMMIKHPDGMNEFEQKHTPDIIVGELNDEDLTPVDVKIGVNGIVHPSEEIHWIDYMIVYLDGLEAERKEIENGPGSNEASFLLDLSDVKEITVEIGCNLHGIWFNSIFLTK